MQMHRFEPVSQPISQKDDMHALSNCGKVSLTDPADQAKTNEIREGRTIIRRLQLLSSTTAIGQP